MEDYITATAAKHPTYMPHTAGRYQARRFRKAQCPIVERMTNSLMMHGRNNGKKLLAVRIIKHAMEIIHLLTDQNPIQVIVDAVINRYLYLMYSVVCSLMHSSLTRVKPCDHCEIFIIFIVALENFFFFWVLNRHYNFHGKVGSFLGEASLSQILLHLSFLQCC